MKILVVGAGGKTGQLVVERALDAGHQVTAFVHSADEYEGANVRLIEGDATDAAKMSEAVADQDAVIDTIGGKTPYKHTTLEESVARAINSAMQDQGVRRLIVTSMMGEGDSWARASLFQHLLIPTFLRGARADKAHMEAEVESSNLDWIIARPAVLTDDEATGEIRVYTLETDSKGHHITRADLAHWMVEQLSSDRYLHQAVAIANS